MRQDSPVLPTPGRELAFIWPWTQANELWTACLQVCSSCSISWAVLQDRQCPWCLSLSMTSRWREWSSSWALPRALAEWPSWRTAPVDAVVVALTRTATSHLLRGQNILSFHSAQLTESRTLERREFAATSDHCPFRWLWFTQVQLSATWQRCCTLYWHFSCPLRSAVQEQLKKIIKN